MACSAMLPGGMNGHTGGQSYLPSSHVMQSATGASRF